MEDGSRDDPTLDRFEAEIAKYRAVQEEIQALPTSATIGYIKIDAKPIKQALTTWVTKWIYLFTHYLQIKVSVTCLSRNTIVKHNTVMICKASGMIGTYCCQELW